VWLAVGYLSNIQPSFIGTLTEVFDQAEEHQDVRDVHGLLMCCRWIVSLALHQFLFQSGPISMHTEAHAALYCIVYGIYEQGLIVDLDNNTLRCVPDNLDFMPVPWRLAWRLFNSISKDFNVFQHTHPQMRLICPPDSDQQGIRVGVCGYVGLFVLLLLFRWTLALCSTVRESFSLVYSI